MADRSVAQIVRAIERRVGAIVSFRATVASVSGSLVTIQREGATAPDDELYPSCTRFPLQIGDVVLCVPMGNKPVIIDVIQRSGVAAPSFPIIVKDTNFTLQDDGDPTKQAKFQASGIGAGATRTYGLPNASGSLALANAAYFNPPGPTVVDATQVTVLASNNCGARYLGMTETDVTSIEVNVRVTTAAATITWAEIALASIPSATSGNLTLLGTATNVAGSFNSTGNKSITFAIAIPAGTHVCLVFGSQATTPFQLRATIADELGIGLIRTASTTRPSTMGAPTAFSTSTALTAAVWTVARWA